MKKSIVFLMATVVLTSLSCKAADNDPRRLNFKQSGFSITALEASGADSAYTVLAMFLPASDNFAPNVNVAIQPFEGSIQDYIKLTRGQLQAGNYALLNEKPGSDSVAWEYAGKMGDLDLHWYCRALLKDGRIYLVAATAAESQWKELAAKLKLCVDSFNLEKR